MSRSDRGVSSLKFIAALIIVLISLLKNSAFALGTHIEINDPQQIIDILPTQSTANDLRDLQDRLRRNPRDWQAVVMLGNRYLDLAAHSGDERYLGYAQQMLSCIVDRPHPASVDLLQARLLQRQHRFDAALAVLNPLLQKNPRAAEAHLLVAYIDMAQGEAAAALPHCAATLALGPITALHCSLRARALLGDAQSAFDRLLAIEQRDELSAVERDEIAATIAEIAERLGHNEMAIPRWQQILRRQPDNMLARLHLADLYLRTRRFDDCWNLLADKAQTGSLLLRKTLAARALQRSDAIELQKRLHNYFDIEKLRNPDYASRDYALYLFQIDNDVDDALRIALKNWRTQREPEDALMVLQAAARANNSSAEVVVVQQWLRDTRLQDVRIAAIDHSNLASITR